MCDKLYLVTRHDLTHGQQAAQLVHGMASFSEQNNESFKKWTNTSNIVVCLSVKNEESLIELYQTISLINSIDNEQIKYAVFKEPDLDNTLTCVVFNKLGKLKKLCKNMQLACK